MIRFILSCYNQNVLKNNEKFKKMLLLFFTLKVKSSTPSILVASDHPIMDRYIWIKYDQDNDEKYLTLQSDGSVVLSLKGKYKITAPTQPSASIRQMLQKFVITLDDFPICNNGYNNRPASCKVVWTKKNTWEFIDTKYGTMIANDGLCMTKGIPLYEDGEPTGETDLLMLPCDYSVDQMFTIVITQDRNWQPPE